jgi:hypothetical protein
MGAERLTEVEKKARGESHFEHLTRFFLHCLDGRVS